MSRFTLQNLRAALWTVKRLRDIRSQLQSERVDRIRVDPPPRLPDDAIRGVLGTLARRPNTCLERALILQSWHASHGRHHEVVIGVKGQSTDFAAHAWVDGKEAWSEEDSFAEILRLPARDAD